MSNIFENRDRDDLVKDRKVRPVKGTPLGQPAPRKPEPSQTQNKTPQASVPQAQNEGLLSQPQPSKLYEPVSIAPPMNYGVISGQSIAERNPAATVQAQIQAKQMNNNDILLPTLLGQVYNNPVSTDSFNEDYAERYSEQALKKQKEAWNKYIIPSSVGISPSTQFNEDGSVRKTVPEEEVQRGIRGLTSELGKSLEDTLDKDNWFNRNLKRTGAFFGYAGNALDMLNQKIIETIPFSPQSMGQSIGKLIYRNDPDVLKNQEEHIQNIKDEFWGKTLPDFADGERSRGYELQSNEMPKIGDYGRAGVLSLGAYLLNLPENLVSAGVYEFSDAWRRQKKANQEIDNLLLKSTLDSIVPVTSIAEGTWNMIKDVGVNAAKELIYGTDSSDDGRLVQILKGKDLSIAGRWSEEKYLGVQEPDNIKLGERTGNWWWDLPENIHDNLKRIGINTNLKAIHWGTQGVLATALELGLDSPIDVGIEGLRKVPRLLANNLTDTGRVVSSELAEQAAKNLPRMDFTGQVPEMPVIRIPNNVTGKPYDVFSTSERTFITSPDLVDLSSVEGNVLPMVDDIINPDIPKVRVPIDLDDIIPNSNKAQSALVQLQAYNPTLRHSNDLVFEFRDAGDRSVLARSLVGHDGKAISPRYDDILQERELAVLAEAYPREFTPYGKPVNPKLEYATEVNLRDGTTTYIQRTENSVFTPPKVKSYDELVEDLDVNMTKLRSGEGDVNSLLLERQQINLQARRTLARMDDKDYYLNHSHLPSDLYGTSPETMKAGTEFVKVSRDIEAKRVTLSLLENEARELESVIQGLNRRIDNLPKIGSIDVEENTQALYEGLDDALHSRITKQPSRVMPSDADADAALDLVPRQTRYKEANVEEFWLHGTQSDSMDIRSYLPREGSGTHELGLGVYFTKRKDVATSAARAFGDSNVPTRFERQVGKPMVKRLSTKRLRGILDLNQKVSKSDFRDLFQEAFNKAGLDNKQFNNFWHSFQDTDKSLFRTWNTFRVWYKDEFGTDAPETLVRMFQQNTFDRLAKDFDAGVMKGVNGEETLVVYNPEKLINVDAQALDEDTVDAIVDALEARRFLEDYTRSQVPDDVIRQSRAYKAHTDLLEYQEQRVAESYATEYLEQSKQVDELTRKHGELAEASDVESFKKAEEFSAGKVAEEAKTQYEHDLPKGRKATDEVSDLMRDNAKFRKYRQRYEKELKKLDSQLLNPDIKGSKRTKLVAKRQRLINAATDVDNRINTLRSRVKSLLPNEPDNSPVWQKFEHLRDILNSHTVQLLDPSWRLTKGKYARMNLFARTKLRLEQIVSEFIESKWGGEWGKVQSELAELRRLGRGKFADVLAKLEADKVIAQVHRDVWDKLSPYGLSKEQFGIMFSRLAELQMSPYILDSAVKANSNAAKYLQGLLNADYKRFMEWGIPKHVIDEVAMEIKKVPQVYEEVYHIVEKTGINFGHEDTLGYLPRLGTSQFKRSMEGVDLGEGVSLDSFVKSRKSFDYVVEDSAFLDEVIKQVNPKLYKETLPEVLRQQGLDPNVSSINDLIGGDDNILSYALIEALPDETVDMLVETGVLAKVPFTSEKSAKLLISRHELPFDGLNDIFITDPQRAFAQYKHGLEKTVANTSMLAGLLDNHTWAVNTAFLKGLSPEDAKVYADWVSPKSFLTDSLKSNLDETLLKQLDELKVHPLVADVLKAQLHIETSPFLTGIIGQTVNTLFKYISGSLLGTVTMFTNNIVGNMTSLLARNVSPMRMTHYIQMWGHAKWDALRKGFDVAHIEDFMGTHKAYGGGKWSQKQLYNEAVKRGLITEFNALGDGSVPTNRLSDMPRSVARSAKEFIHFAKTGKHKWASGLISRALEGAESVMDNTMFKWVSFANVLTDNAYRFSLLEAVLADNPLTANNLMDTVRHYLTDVPHFTDMNKAVKWVERNSYLFDDVGQNEGLMRFLVPFYTWQRKSMVNTVRFIADRPARFGKYLKILNHVQNEFEHERNEEWNNIVSYGWLKNNSIVPFVIPADVSASGEDEVYVFPVGQFVPQLGSFKTVLDVVDALGFSDMTKPPHKNPANPMSVQSKNGMKSFIVSSGSPWLKGMLAFIDPDYLYEYDRDYTPLTDIRRDYPFGLNKTGYQMLKLYGRPIYNVWKNLPESLTGRAPTLNRKTGEYDEGKPSAFTGQLPHWTRSTAKAPLGREGLGGHVSSLTELFGLAPYHIDTLFAQEKTMKEIESQLYKGKQEIRRIMKQLEKVNVNDTETRKRAEEEVNTLTLSLIHLSAELELYKEWRRLNGIPHHRAVDKILSENIQVDRELPEDVREEIYRKNYEKYSGYFQR